VRRIEMITGGGWAALDSGREGADRRGDAEPGRTVPVIARRHVLTPQQLFAWRREARK